MEEGKKKQRKKKPGDCEIHNKLAWENKMGGLQDAKQNFHNRRKRKNKGDAQNAIETSMMKEKWVIFRMGDLWNAKQTSMENEKWVIFGMQNKLSWKEKG